MNILNQLIDPKYTLQPNQKRTPSLYTVYYQDQSIGYIIYNTDYVAISRWIAHPTKINTQTIPYDDPDYQIKINNILDEVLNDHQSRKHL